MAYNFTNIPLSNVHLLWMKEMYAKFKLGEEANYRQLQVALWKKIPPKFNGYGIDERLVHYGRLTLLGILHVDPESEFVQKTDQVIRTIRDMILKNPDERRIKAEEIAGITHLPVGEVNMIFGLLDDLNFVGIAARAKSGGFSEVTIGGFEHFEPYLEYEDMKTLIQNAFGDSQSKRSDIVVTTGEIEMEATIVSKTSVFIGHGRSVLWARLKIFLTDELGLETISYESESRVGDSIVPVLEKILNEASFAVLILTAEDETVEGARRARQNVVHEAGLFQGRLGFRKAVLLRQEGLEDFSNVAGLQYIGFPGDKIEQTFYELQRVLKREGLLR